MKNLEQEIKDSLKKKHGWDKQCWVYLCSDGYHDSFWKTVVESPQWEAWYKEQGRRFSQKNRKHGVFDIDEVQECGWISQAHFQEFLKFVKKIK